MPTALICSIAIASVPRMRGVPPSRILESSESAMEYANLSTNHGRTATLFDTKSDDTSENIARRVRNTA